MIINGNLTFHTLGDGELQNAVIERIATGSLPAASIAGRLIYDTTIEKFIYDDGVQYIELATGGDATAVQNELDVTQNSMGAMIDTDGTYIPHSGTIYIDGNTNITQDLLDLDAAVAAASDVDTLAELSDVTLTALVDDDFIVSSGGVWINKSPDEVGIGHNIHFKARKATVGTIGKGLPVEITGYGSGFALVELADANTSMPAAGVTHDAITDTAEGEVVVAGEINNMNTNAWS